MKRTPLSVFKNEAHIAIGENLDPGALVYVISHLVANYGLKGNGILFGRKIASECLLSNLSCAHYLIDCVDESGVGL